MYIETSMLYMVSNGNQRLAPFQLGMIAIGAILIVSGMYVTAFRPGWAVQPAGAGAALIAAGLTLVIVTIGRRRREQREEVVVDERISTIGEKSGYRAFQVLFVVQGGLFALVGLTIIDLPLFPVLGVMFGLQGLVYIVAYNWYDRSM